MPEPMYNLSELSRITGKSRTTLRTMCRKGEVSSTQHGNKTMVSRSEVLRAFDGITLEDIERSLPPSGQDKVEAPLETNSRRAGSGRDSKVKELEAQLEELKQTNLERRIELEQLKAKVLLLTSQVDFLERMNQLLTGQIDVKDTQIAMWSRLIPERSQARRGNPEQPRGDDGRYAKKEPKERPAGAGTAALLPDSEN